ncbi:MAG: methyltransferase domain-containing protein [Candidatus Uhrbacteria bacterium]|nr:class I SAM-dependent methyltransferase [Patescibacteria group bacterium]MBU1907252.1 class I SAM-dependent methyltransferase [Patescibacteria group bacterium]
MPQIPAGKALLDAAALLREAGIRVGYNVVDLGSGTSGHFTFPAAHMVGETGKVYAVDILKGALAGIESRARIEGTTNVEPVWGNIERVGGVRVPAGQMDLALLVNVASLIAKSPDVAREAARLLKDNGHMLVIDWKPEGSGFGPPAESRHSAKDILKLFTAHGFVAIKEFDAGPSHWGLLMKKQAK